MPETAASRFASDWFATSKPHFCAGKAAAAKGGFAAKSNSHKTAAMFHNMRYAIFVNNFSKLSLHQRETFRTKGEETSEKMVNLSRKT
ncbi:hypothetical protein [Phyllobacterium bourgognense]|uniref:Uncharacterized protein n=1 Tax=Phyllobacterium bourgognense TaxID=314236 RepID=A0A368YC62_9HYPH|nr:hypothetical protein [Phyllobacterium bourgognense]RCW77705.1 hypothetical protein C7476_13912 [Phyllobacterium bourgognense]